MLHWDGYLCTRSMFYNCYIVEVSILNGGKNSKLGLMPILFISYSSTKLVKDKKYNLFDVFLKPSVDELELAFQKGFEVNFAYPGKDIHLVTPLLVEKSKVKIYLLKSAYIF